MLVIDFLAMISIAHNELVCQKCGKYFPTKAFLKMHTKAIHLNGRERIVQMVQQKENNKIPEVQTYHAKADETHAHHKNNRAADVSNAKNGIHDSKYKRNGAKNSHPWEQDHLTFQINLQ